VTSQVVPLKYDADVVSSRAQRNDGAMNAGGDAYSAEMFPKQIVREGVEFQLGSTVDGQQNALTAHGQSVALPAGKFNRVHLLAAADGDTASQIKIGAVAQPFNVPNWTGYIGQWDNRLWDNPTQTIDLSPSQPPVGLVPGYIKRTPVAWFATHHNTLQGDAYYNFSYLFELSYDLPAGTKSLKLPNNAKLRIFAVSVANEPGATPPAAPLYDTLADHQPSGVPVIPQAGQTFNQMTDIAIIPPLYHQPGDLHYTVDGSNPTVSSPVYTEPFPAEATVKLAVAQFDEHGKGGPVVRGVIEIQDLTPPQLVSALAGKNLTTLELTFSKPLDSAAAVEAKNYAIQPALAVRKISQSTDGSHVTLTFAAPIPAGTDYALNVSGVKDQSSSGNFMAPATQSFHAQNIVYSLKSAHLPDQHVKVPVAGLPLKKNDAWTMNVLVKPDHELNDRVIIAGFGRDVDNSEGGTSRYFAVLDNEICFWSAKRDVVTGSPLETGHWQMLTATYNGKTLTVYKDGDPIGKKDVELNNDSDAYVNIGTPDPWEQSSSFHGMAQNFTIRRGTLTAAEVRELYGQTKPD
jgi:alpha-mannosidase